MGRRIVNEALRTIVNAERRGKATAQHQPMSTVMTSFLSIMKSRGYIKDFQVFDPHRVGRITVELQGRIKDCKAVMHRQYIMAKDIEKYRLRNLPTRQFYFLKCCNQNYRLPFLQSRFIRGELRKLWGYVVVTTPNGVLDHEEAIKQNVGGQVLGYFH